MSDSSKYHELKLLKELPTSARSNAIIQWKTRRRRRAKISMDFQGKSTGARENMTNNSKTEHQKSRLKIAYHSHRKHCSRTWNMHNSNSVLADANRRVAWLASLVWPLLLLLLLLAANALAATRPPDEHPNVLTEDQWARPELNGEHVALDLTAQDNADLPLQSHTKRSVQTAKRTFQAQQQERLSRVQLAFGLPEPPALVEYSNSSGATIQCRPVAADTRITISWRQLVKSTRGNGEPLLFDEREVPWTTRQPNNNNNRSRTGASGPLVRPDGALLLPAFDPVADRQHPAQTFRCCLALPLTQDAGAHTSEQPATLCSRLVTTRAVIDSYLPPAELVVFDKLTRPNQLAILRCQAPSHLMPHLEFINWLKDDRILPTVDETKLARRLGALGANDDNQLDLKYLTTSGRGGGGELIIRNVSKQLDATSYKCRVRNKLTGRVTTSEAGAKLMVLSESDQTGGTLHASNESQHRVKVVLAQEQTDVLICAEFPSHSLGNAKFQWSRAIEGRRVPLAHSGALRPSATSEYKQLDSCLLIGQVQHERHSGEYTCDVGASGAKQTFHVLVVASKLDVQLQVSGSSAASVQHGPGEHEDRTQQSVIVVVNANAKPQKVSKHFVTFSSPVQLNCTLTDSMDQDKLTRPQVDTIAWFKDSKLLFATKLPDDSADARPSQDQHNHLATNSTLNIRLEQPNVITIDPFDLHNRGIYQCLVFSSLVTSGQNRELARDDRHQALIEQVKNFLVEAETGGEQVGAPRNRSQRRDDHRQRPAADFHHEASLLAAQLESAGLQQSTSAAVAVDLDLVLSKPQLVQKFPVASSHAQGAQMSLECSASGLPPPKIIWLLDDFVIGASENQVLSPTGSDLGAQSGATVRELVTFVSSSEQELMRLDLDDAANSWPVATTSGQQVPRDTSNQMLNVMEEEPRFQVTSSRRLGQVTTSQLNVTNLLQVDMGQYTCLALNAHGQVAHTGRVLVVPRASAAGQQPDQVQARSYQPTNVTLTAGSNATLHCPLVGHQVARIDWFHAGQRLPTSRRQRIGVASSGSKLTGASGQQLEIENVDPSQDGGVYTCQAHLGDQWLEQVARSAPGAGDAQQVVYNLSESAQVPAEARVRVRVHVPPLIDVQSLPEIVQATEGMRTKLVCSIVQGDPGPVEIRWLRRMSDPKRTIRLTGGGRQLLVGYESMQNVAAQALSARSDDSSDASNQISPTAATDSITVHNLDDSCLLTFKQISHLDSGDYLCVAQNQLSFSARQVRVVVSVPPNWSIEPPEDVYVLQHERLQLDCLAYGHPQPVASWRRAGGGASSSPTSASNFKQIPQMANGTLVIDPVDEDDAGLYLCEQTNGIGSGLSRLVRLHVQVPPHFAPTAHGQQGRANVPAVHTGRLGQFAELKCLVLGDQPLLVGWRKEQPAPEVIDLMQDKRRQVTTSQVPRTLHPRDEWNRHQALESTLNVTNLSRQDSGVYSCVASNEFGTREHQLQLLVQEPPEEPQLMRPIKAESRQATLTFKQPFDGNSPVTRYAIHYRHLPEWHSPVASSWPDQQVDDSGGGGSDSKSLTDDDQWKQVFVDAPQQQQRQLGANHEAAAASSELVNLNLCCLKPFSRYAVRVRALNGIGPSELSKPVRFQTQEETIGGPPLDVSVEPTGAHSLKVRWREPARQLQNGLIRGYYIGYRALVAPAPPLQSPAHLPSLLGGPGGLSTPVDSSEQYQYKNVQLDLNPLLVASSSSSGSSQDPLMTNSAQFLEPASDQPERESMFTTMSGHNVSSSSIGNRRQQHLSTYLTNLRRKTAYSIIVQAYNKVGAGPRSDQILVATLDAAPPMSPLLKLVSATYNSAQFAWSARKFNKQNRKIDQLPSDLDREMARHTLEIGTASPLDLDFENADDEDDDPQAYYTLNYKLDERYLQFGIQDDQRGRTGEQVVVAQQSNQAQQTSEWQQKRVTKRGGNLLVGNSGDHKQQQQQAKLGFVLAGLRCGSAYLAYMTATNSLGQSEPGETIKFATRGGAPVPPQSSQDFLVVNSTYLIMRLDAWHAPGCPIRSFTIKYKLTNQAKWIILEHQVNPTIQTITIAGTSVFSTRPAAASGALQLINSQQMASEASAAASSPQSQPPPAARLGDFILRNLLALTQYKLVVEANSEAGSSLVEYEFDTTNLTSSTLAVQVNGLVAAASHEHRKDDDDDESQAAHTGKRGDDQFARIANSGHQERGAANSIMNSFSSVWTTGGGGGGTHSGRSLATSQPGLGVWSLTVVFVFASIVMAITTLVLGVKSLLRLRQTRCGGGGGHSPADASSSPEGRLASSLLCCTASSSSASSASSSSSGSRLSERSGVAQPRNCYASQMAAPPGELYCSLPNNQRPNIQLGKYQHTNHIALTDSPGACAGADFGAATISGLLRDSREPALETSYGCAGHYGALGDNQSSCARPSHSSMVSSASLSAILNGQQHRYPQSASNVCNNNNNRHALTLAPVNRANRTSGYGGGERAQPSSDNTLRLNSHYAATLGRQQQQQQSSFSPMSQQRQQQQQPIKFNQSYAIGADSETQFNQLFSAALLKQQTDTIAADRMTATSGYGTSASLASAGNFNCRQMTGANNESCDQQAAGGYLLAQPTEQYQQETTTTTAADGLLLADGTTCYAGDAGGGGNEQRTKHDNQGQLAFVGVPPVDLYNCAGLQVDGGQQFMTHTGDGMLFNQDCSQNSQF